jgi:hypothetical protein
VAFSTDLFECQESHHFLEKDCIKCENLLVFIVNGFAETDTERLILLFNGTFGFDFVLNEIMRVAVGLRCYLQLELSVINVDETWQKLGFILFISKF